MNFFSATSGHGPAGGCPNSRLTGGQPNTKQLMLSSVCDNELTQSLDRDCGAIQYFQAIVVTRSSIAIESSSCSTLDEFDKTDVPSYNG